MSRYIDADKLKIVYASKDVEKYADAFSKLVDAIPTAGVRENVVCEWTKEEGYVAGDREWKCSICGATFWNGSMDRYHYCPNCGADMRGDA